MITVGTSKDLLDRRPLNLVVTEGKVCMLPVVSVSRTGKPLMKVCLAVLRPPGVPRKLRPDGTEDPDYPWFSLEGDLVPALAPRIRKGDRLFIRGAITTRNIDEKQLALNGEEIVDLRMLLSTLSDYLNGTAQTDEESLTRLRELIQKFNTATNHAVERKRVLTEIAASALRVLRDRIEPGESIELTASSFESPPITQDPPLVAVALPTPGVFPSLRKKKKKKKHSPATLIFETHHAIVTPLHGLTDASSAHVPPITP